VFYKENSLTLSQGLTCPFLQFFGVAAVAEGDSDDNGNVLAVTSSSTSEGWVLDSACSFHLCPNRDSFASYKSTEGTDLMRNDMASKIVGIGTIKVKMYDGIVRTLTEVRHVPELKKNLISTGALDTNGCKIVQENGVLKVSPWCPGRDEGQQGGKSVSSCW
jgi:hypothetical protein